MSSAALQRGCRTGVQARTSRATPGPLSTTERPFLFKLDSLLQLSGNTIDCHARLLTDSQEACFRYLLGVRLD